MVVLVGGAALQTGQDVVLSGLSGSKRTFDGVLHRIERAVVPLDDDFRHQA